MSRDAVIPDSQAVPDSQYGGMVARLPQLPRDLAMLARFDRPIGWWLLFWPCAWGVWLAGAGWQLPLLGWLLLGSMAASVVFVMVGCLAALGPGVSEWLRESRRGHPPGS